MILSDGTIRERLGRGELLRTAIADHQVQSASIDLRLGPTYLDPVTRARGQFPLWLHADQFLLGCTVEVVTLPSDIAARVEGKSSLGRQGLVVHSTAGFLDPGFEGQVTLELSTAGRCSVHLTPGMLVCQLSFEPLDRPAERPYGHPGLRSHYQGQMGPTLAAVGELQAVA